MPHYQVPNDPFPHSLPSEEFEHLLPPGFTRISDDLAGVMLAAANAPSLVSLKAASIERVKELRRMVFATLAGLQSEASTKGDTATAVGILPVQEALKNLPQTDLSSCQTQADIDMAFVNAWADIVAITPANVVSAFNGVM